MNPIIQAIFNIFPAQIGTLLTSLVMMVMTITSLVMATPLLDLLGPTTCDIYNFVTLIHNTLIVTGGFVMALFRLICIRFQSSVSTPERLMAKLMRLQLAIFSGVFISAWWGVNIYGSSNFYEFCRGYTTKVTGFGHCNLLFKRIYILGRTCDFEPRRNHRGADSVWKMAHVRGCCNTTSLHSPGAPMLHCHLLDPAPKEQIPRQHRPR